MSEAMIQTLITAIITLVGTFGGILTAQKLSNYRIAELEKKVDKMNDSTTDCSNRILVLEKEVSKVEVLGLILFSNFGNLSVLYLVEVLIVE